MRKLESYKTEELIRLLNLARKYGGHYKISPPHPDGYSIEEIKKVLATREHVPNKIERKLIRQTKAKEKKSNRNH